MLFARFSLLTPVGAGRHNRRRDVFNTRQTLGRLGYVEPRAGAREDTFDFGLDDGLRRFQRDKGLKVDGWLAPGGDTERALKRATAPRPARTPWPDPFRLADHAGRAEPERSEKETSAHKRAKKDPFATATPHRETADLLGMTEQRRRERPGNRIKPSASPRRSDRSRSEEWPPVLAFGHEADRSGGQVLPTAPILPPVTAASRAENGRLVEALTRTTNPGYVPDYIVDALSGGGGRAMADVADLFAQYAARDERGARRLVWEVQRRAQDMVGVRQRLGQPATRTASVQNAKKQEKATPSKQERGEATQVAAAAPAISAVIEISGFMRALVAMLGLLPLRVTRRRRRNLSVSAMSSTMRTARYVERCALSMAQGQAGAAGNR